MRFTEIANPEDQLALWKLISDKMWAAFALPVSQGIDTRPPQPTTPQGRVASLASKRSINHVPCLTSSDVMGVGA